ncbi:MAG: TonB-dependent receptor [Steroidobacteraceae bacterium]
MTASLWRDQSDTNAAQLALVAPQIPFPPIIAGLQAAGYTPTNARVADWDPGSPKKRDDRLYQISLRGDYTMGGGVQLTSITAYSNMQMRRDPADVDATAFPNGFVYSDAAINVFSQELRVSGAAKQWHWMLGGSYQRTNSTTSSNANLNSTNALGLYDQAAEPDNQAIGTSAAFGSLEFLATDAIRARASVRYTKDNNTHQGCLADGGNGKLPFAFGQLIFPALGGVPTNIPPGGCVTLDDATKRVITPMPTQLLDESNVSWRVGLDWKPAPGALLYASIAKGYKAGAFAQIPSVFESQQQPVTQESVLDYEIGLKMDLLDRRAHIDFSTFYYDYKNKQLQGYVNIPPFGALPTLVNIPSSRVIGAEATLTANLTNNLRVQLAGTVLDTKVQKNPSNPLDPFGAPTSFIGESFPNTPKYQANADIEQTFPISGNANIFLGGDIRYRSSASGAFGSTSSARASEVTTLVSYGLVDVRAGLRLAHPDFSVELWGDNLTNKYYYVSTLQYIDTLVRYAGQPRSYGIRLRYQF